MGLKAFAFAFSLALASSGLADAPAPALACDSEFKIPENWRSRPLGELDFYISTRPTTHSVVLQTPEGPKPFSEFNFAKESVLFPSFGAINDEYCKELQKVKNPVVLYYHGDIKNMKAKELALVEKAKAALGKRFLGFSRGEWFPYSYIFVSPRGKTPYLEACKKYGIPLCSTRDDGYHLFELEYDAVFGAAIKKGLPIYAFCATFFPHWECRQGVAITGVEIGGDERCTPMQLAFTRGASRQYNVPWTSYIASWGGGIKGDSETRFWQYYVRPDVRTVIKQYNADLGPYSGTSISIQKRFLYVSYMAGANMVTKETASEAFFASYDETAADRMNPRVLVLQDKKNYLSPIGRIYNELYDGIVKKHDRGVPYTPVALMFDKNHGFAPEYSRDFLVGMVPFQRGDDQMRAVVNTLFPWEERAKKTRSFETNTNVTGPFGDIFDVLTSDASADVISSYKALSLAGDVRMDANLEKSLKLFVENGGTLFMAASQMTPVLWELAGLSDSGETLKGKGGIAADGKTEIREDREFQYKKVALKGAAPLVKSAENPDCCLATVNKVGKGSVIVGTPDWMMAPDSKNKMLNLYSYLMSGIRDGLVPVAVSGDVQVLYNKTPKGWALTLVNNNGVYKFPGRKEVVKEEEAVTAVLKPKFKCVSANEWLTGEKLDGLSVTVPPGDVRIVEITIE